MESKITMSTMPLFFSLSIVTWLCILFLHILCSPGYVHRLSAAAYFCRREKIGGQNASSVQRRGTIQRILLQVKRGHFSNHGVIQLFFVIKIRIFPIFFNVNFGSFYAMCFSELLNFNANTRGTYTTINRITTPRAYFEEEQLVCHAISLCGVSRVLF